uniref:Protein ELFN1-like n=1 Tax=Callorhinchus milii TaxID=7868 RepID=A0A4W3J288_CALMI|eukprot:gi/632974922/ref/XP_007903942.1/ PREDICTED: protein ELFN1-like [Callorhinchus milii]
MALFSLCLWVSLVVLMNAVLVRADCWLIEGEKGFVWLAICSQNQPPYEAIPQHINSTVVDLRLNENKIKSIQFSSLNRFGNLTDLNLTKNDISYIEDGAFSAQFNLRILQLGFNRLRNLTEGMLRGLGRLEYLYLQANLIEIVSPNTFWECLSIINIDLSMNRLQMLESSTFTGLSKLYVFEIYGNPFHCSCELLGFLNWFAQFTSTARSTDRTQCASPADVEGDVLLNQRGLSSKSALTILASTCDEEVYSIDTKLIFNQPPTSQPVVPEGPCGIEDCPSGDGSTLIVTFQTPFSETNDTPVIKLKEVNLTTATLRVHVPSVFNKMYILVQFNKSFFTDIKNLSTETEEIEIKGLKPQTKYTYCVTSIQNSLRYNHTCLTFPTRNQAKAQTTTSSKATHYIMSVLGCLFGLVIVLGVIYYCVRRRRLLGGKHKKSGSVKKTIIELKYGPELETITITQLSQKPVPPGDPMSPRVPFLPASEAMDDYDIQEIPDSPKAIRGSYMDVRTGEHSHHRDVVESMFGENQSSTAEISTIAKEVDKVNQIINNCIDALKSESGSFQGGKSGAGASVDPQLLMITENPQGRSNFLSPVYQDGYHHLQRHSSMDVIPKSSSMSSNCSMRSPRLFRSETSAGPFYTSETKYIERMSPTRSAVRSASSGPHLRSDAMRQYGEHCHLYAGMHHGEQRESRSQSPCVMEPLSRSRRNLAYSQFSPQYHNISYSSSPEYSSRSSKGVWERYKPHEKCHRREEYLAAGYALRKKVQFATDEDLHDILDYWKGVSAQHKS